MQKKQQNQELPFQGGLQMSLLKKDSRTAFSGEAADGNISSGMFVCSCNSRWGQAIVIALFFEGGKGSIPIIDYNRRRKNVSPALLR